MANFSNYSSDGFGHSRTVLIIASIFLFAYGAPLVLPELWEKYFVGYPEERALAQITVPMATKETRWKNFPGCEFCYLFEDDFGTPSIRSDKTNYSAVKGHLDLHSDKLAEGFKEIVVDTCYNLTVTSKGWKYTCGYSFLNHRTTAIKRKALFIEKHGNVHSSFLISDNEDQRTSTVDL